MAITFEQLSEVIAAVHAAPHMFVIEFAGAGAQALTWLHRVGGSSRTILEATDRYASNSLVDALGFEPEQFASPEAARALANHAYRRARQLAEPGTPLAGVGCAATIATDRLKLGDHRCCLAVRDDRGLSSGAVTFDKGLRSREDEERLISLLLIRAVAQVCGLEGLPEPDFAAAEILEETYESVDLLSELLAGEVNWVALAPDGRMTAGHTWPNVVLLSGAFNPLHMGHLALARAAAAITGRDVYFELPLVNAAKGVIDPMEARRRAAQFAGRSTIIFSRVPLFNQKAEIFPESIFLLGADTAQRLVQARFYNRDPAQMRAAFETIRAAGCHFLVAGRLDGDRYLNLQDLNLSADLRDLFEEIPEQQFRLDLSSTDIRQGPES
jgi:hypothetical protein